ncbi:glycosyltransferase [bacterium]|nr:glycosyltransferase [bacterium]
MLNSPVYDFNRAENSTYLREKFCVPGQSKIFIYVGILGNGRGIDLLLKVFKRKEVSSTLIFLGYGELSETIERIACETHNIFIHDPVPHEQVVPVISSSDYGLCLIQNVSLSDFYSLPNKLFEYFFAEVPVLASNFPDISGLVEEHKLGLCCSLDENSIFESIQKMQVSSYNFEFKDQVLQELSWASQKKKLLDLYHNL